MTGRSDFRLGRAFLHALAAIVLVAIVSGVLGAVYGVADPRRFGEGVGRFILFMGLGALGVSWLAQTGRRVAAIVAGGLLTALVIGLVVAVAMVAPTKTQGTGGPGPAFKADLVRTDDALRHPVLEFSIPDPGPGLVEQPGLAKTLASGPGERAWVYADLASSEVFMVVLAARMASDAPTFEDFFRGVLAGQTGAAQGAEATVEERERWVRWEERRAHAHVVLDGVTHMRVDAFGLPGGEGVVMVSASRDEARFEALAAGVVTAQ